ncbi:MAG: sulfite exporter TauE/SafE family protein [Chloroflexi bacterium]|nr:sulfite exporter TauE/SafE family protein [Chloroflexota bacterium]MDA1001837.1 sulfite exporter TauE/SafE family protein [Chloroflexota bacterium]
MSGATPPPVVPLAPPSPPRHTGVRALARAGYPRSFLIGSAFSVAWSPCIGPILGVVLTLAATSGTAAQGGLLLLAYSLGLGVWFIAFGAFFGWLGPRLRVLQPHMQSLMVVSGAVFIVVGALMFLGEFTRLNNYFAGLGFLFSGTANAEESLSGGVDSALGPAVAFFGGLVSFLSPCVLPLVPAYLVNIAGEAVLSGTDARGDERRRVLLHAIAFVVGFSLVFTVLGASAGFAGSLLTAHIETMTRVGGALLMVFGMHMSGLIHVPFLDRTYQVTVR